MEVRLGTRGSTLAMIQAEMTKIRILEVFPGAEVKIVTVKTEGDIQKDRPLSQFGGKGAFALGIEKELSEGNIDIAVHSGKDLPQKLFPGLAIKGVLKRDDFRDVLVLNAESRRKLFSESVTADTDGKNIVIGTGSLRRKEALKNLLKDRKFTRGSSQVLFKEIRGNVETRLKKVLSGEYDGTLLSAAGLVRMGIIDVDSRGNSHINSDRFPQYKELYFRVLSENEMVPAPCQGIIALETREDNPEINRMVQEISDRETFGEFTAERLVSEILGGSCDIPAGARAEVTGDRIKITYTRDSVNHRKIAGRVEDTEKLVRQLVTGKVFLVGAGCGKADLITLLGLRLLKKADVVVYDELIDQEILKYAPASARLIPAGKRGGRRNISQDEINSILVNEALEGKDVVRLKGGDPFVFGRGGEEITALKEKGISFAVVPGVTSAVAVPEAAGIPVTHRNTARSFHVITGHTSEDLLPENIEKLAGIGGTLVFLMGLRHLKSIAGSLIKGGIMKDTPAAVVSDGGRYSVRGTVENIYEKTTEAGIKAPAVIVIGTTAGYDFRSELRLPLDNVKIAYAGTESFSEKMEEVFAGLGASLYRVFRLSVEEYESNPEADRLIMHPELSDRIVFTSPNGVKIFKRRMKKLHTDIRSFYKVRFAVLGNGTRNALEDMGIIPELVPHEFTAECLACEIVKTMKPGERITVLRAEKGSPVLNRIFDDAGAVYRDIKIYDVKKTPDEPGMTVSADAMVFASASGVEEFYESGCRVSEKTKIFCIGDITGKALEKRGIKEYYTASRHDVTGLSECISEYFAKGPEN